MKTMLFLFKNHIHDVNDLLIIMSYVLAKLHFYVDCNIYYLPLPGLWPIASLITMITYIHNNYDIMIITPPQMN